ncbi:Pol polyprotein [Plakobranchus ocellatus]|uniref:Pol polyprotein n=1 Tax=Plakobranchus ocellatus TaxID=259542 RepID=A0AAV4CXS4_9GAST|nr:Pol polyprotein [Plakobranchus ocellatus]
MTIKLKPEARPKHQKPYRLSPDKKKVLKHQLEHLLEQGIIAPSSAHEDIPITSPVVLVEKRTKSETKNTSEKERSLRSYRFCVDFRFLNSQTEEFCYPIPNIQDLTESVNNSHPKFISCFNLSSGFFQMKISESSSKYTAFNTHVGGFKFLRVPQGI